jgi:iron complex outermembrane receptor protein
MSSFLPTCLRLAACAAILAGCGADAADAQSLTADPPTLKHLSLEELSKITVTSVEKDPASVARTPAAIYVITQEDIARSGATSIPDLLRFVPGVDVARIDTSRNWVVGIRGFGDQFSKSVLVMIDGRVAYTPLWAGVHWPIQDTLLEDIDRIEIIRGAGGTIWGSNAQNGVINIITKSAQATRGLYASVATGNVDHAVAGVRYGAGNDAGVSFRAYAQGSDRAPQFHVDGREFDTWTMGQGGFRVDWARGLRDQITVQADGYTAKLGESVRVSTFTPPATALIDDPVHLNGANIRARWYRRFDADADLSIQGYVDHTYRLGTDFGERRWTYDLDATHRWRFTPRHEVTWGFGARNSPGRIVQTLSFSDFDPHQKTFTLLSAFAQDSFALKPDRLTLTGGLKLEHNTYTGLELQPSGRVLWTPTDRQTVWGAVTRAVRTPTRVDEDITVTGLLTASPPVYAVIAGNRDLDAETVIDVEGGYRALVNPSLYVDVAVFTNAYDNLVDLGAPTAQTRTTEGTTYTALVVPWINGIEGRTRGVEIAPRWQAASRVRLSGSYSYVDLALDPKPGNVLQLTLPALEGSTPHHRVSLQALLTLPRRVQVDPVYRYVSERTRPFIGSYHAVDLHIAVPIGRTLELAVAGQNLFDPHHPEWARDPGPTVEIRRSAYVRLTWRR